jgi:hypothetical protein
MCGTKLTKALLKHLVNDPIDFGKEGAGPDCRRALLDSLQLLLSPFKFQQYQESQGVLPFTTLRKSDQNGTVHFK